MPIGVSPDRGVSVMAEQPLGDFTATRRIVMLSAIAIVLGGVSAFLALILLRMIAFVTNLFFFGRLSTATVSPADNNLGAFVILVPVIGALIIGMMARFGSERIRGHGIPEAIEAILIGGSRIQPRVAVLKPLSSGISIGSGGPFGAEGPIIMTGGAFGSLVAQFFNLTSAERKTLLVAGAAAGMSATFASPVAAVLLAVELLLFEWKPRSLVPVALASATAMILRRYLLGLGPLFPTPIHEAYIGPWGLALCVVAGLLAGGLSALLTAMVYAAEDAFHRLPIHWMWWPAIGGLVVGVGGLIFPEALGVGYDVIETLIRGDATTTLILGVLLVKSTIWAVSLGSGTSGGVLAPLLMRGGALGGLEAMVFPDHGPGFWPIIGMAAILGGTMRAPLTGIVFTLELTHDINLLLPLLCATAVAHGCTVLIMRRSILTEKIDRRGFHVSREYAVDPLEVLFVRDVMRTEIVALPAEMPLDAVLEPQRIRDDRGGFGQGLYPVLDDNERLVGVVTRSDLRALVPNAPGNGHVRTLREIAYEHPLVAFPNESLRRVMERMATTGLTRFPVVLRDQPNKLVGMITLADFLRARQRSLEEERTRERVLTIRFPIRGDDRTLSPNGTNKAVAKSRDR
ncbi:MAG TPA: chloride channel protein [Thermomicrobiales bacterium]|nr:chloride channel protein [Thermomicrobiales bacterium]